MKTRAIVLGIFAFALSITVGGFFYLIIGFGFGNSGIRYNWPVWLFLFGAISGVFSFKFSSRPLAKGWGVLEEILITIAISAGTMLAGVIISVVITVIIQSLN